MIRLQVSLDHDEARALAEIAYADLRDVRDQIRYIVRQELERRGLLPDEQSQAPLECQGVPHD